MCTDAFREPIEPVGRRLLVIGRLDSKRIACGGAAQELGARLWQEGTFYFYTLVGTAS